MQNVKKLLPLLLIAAYVASAVFMIQTKVDTKNEYASLVAAGDAYAEKGIILDAVSSYQSAMEIKPSIELSLKIGNIYLGTDDLRSAQRWYTDELLEKYPEDARTYEFGIRTYLMDESYTSAFEVYDTFLSRKLSSETVEQMIDGIRYLFSINGSFDDFLPYSNRTGTAAVCKDGLWGYADGNGSLTIPYQYQSAGVFGTYAAVIDQDNVPSYIDRDGNPRIVASFILEKDPEFGQVVSFKDIQDGLILAFNGEYWNYYSAESYEKQFGGFPDAIGISNGVGAVCNEYGKWALISGDGQLLTEYEYDKVLTDPKGVICRSQTVVAEKEGKYLLLGKDGTQIGNNTYESANAFLDNSYAAVKKGGKWIFVDEAGNEYDLGDYDGAQSFSNGFAAVKKDNRWGYINLTGDLVIEYQFYDASMFTSGGRAFVMADKAYWSLLKLYRG